MWYRTLTQGTRLMDAAGSPAGGAAGDAGAAPAGASASSAPAGITGQPGAAQGEAFDWAGLKLDPEAGALVAERQWKHPNEVIKSYRNLEKLTGVPAEQIIKLPKGDDPKAWNEVYTRLGRPEKADGYKLPVPEGQDGAFAKTAAEWFHEAGVTQAGATRLATKWNEFQAAQQKQQTDQLAARDLEQVNALKSEWGANYERLAGQVDKAAETFGMTPEQLAALKQVMGPKEAMQFMQTIGSKLGVEDGQFHDGQTPTGFNNMSPEQAQAEITRLQRDKLFAQEFNSNDPRVKSEARQKMARLAVLAAPGAREFSGRG
jgi:hypothetical protein